MELLHRLGEDMGEVVPRQIERIRLVARRNQREAGVLRERPFEIDQLPIDPRRQRRLEQAGPDIGGDLPRGGPGLHVAHRAVGKRDVEKIGHERGRILEFAERGLCPRRGRGGKRCDFPSPVTPAKAGVHVWRVTRCLLG